MDKSSFTVLLFYKYISLPDPTALREQQKKLCDSLRLNGRIILAKEGINGTVEGATQSVDTYIAAMEDISFFKGIAYKRSCGNGDAFPKLSVRVRPEIVTTGMRHLDPRIVTGRYITAQQLHAWFASKKEFYIVDMRNKYEFSSGYFENSIPSELTNFYHLASVLPRLAHLKQKIIVTVCTGGIRCEKASGFLLKNGFNTVYQLQNGIHSYMEAYPNEHFKGKLYVFDRRLTIGFHTSDSQHEIVGKCAKCHQQSENYINCAYDFCHRHFICCTDCLDPETGFVFCNSACKDAFLHTLNRTQKKQLIHTPLYKA